MKRQRSCHERLRASVLGSGLTCLLLVASGCGGAHGAAANGAASPAPAADEAWREQRPPAGTARLFDYPSAQVSRLPNGVQLYLVPRKAGTVALSISAHAGGSACGPGKSGLAALSLRLMTEATRKKDALSLAEAAESLGASLDFDTGRDGSSVSLEVLPSDVDAGLALLSEVITEPRFSLDDVTRVKKLWLDSLVSERQEPSRLSSLAGMRALLGTTIGAPVRGSLADVERLTREDLRRFHKEHYVASNLAVIAVGDLTMERLTELSQSSLGGLPQSSPPRPLPLELPPPPAHTVVWLVDRPGSVQSAVFIGQPFPERSAPGHEARQVMNNLLGGLFTSRLNLNLREKHAYTYGVRSTAIATLRWGAFIGMSSIKTENTADALDQLRAELGGLKAGSPNPITTEELDRSKTDLIQGLGANLEHVRRILGDTAELFIDGLPPDYQHNYATLIAKVDQESAAAEARRLDPDHSVIVIVGDRQKIEPLLEGKGLSLKLAPEQLVE